VFQREVDACADAAPALTAANEPGVALANWLQRYTEFVATKRGLARQPFTPAIRRSTPCPATSCSDSKPTLGSLLEAATATGEIRADISPTDLLHAVANLCLSVADDGVAYSQRMVALLIDGLHYPADASPSRS
jgi:hypothetical protein